MEEVWIVMRESLIPDQPNVIVSIHKSEVGAIRACNETDGHVWHNGPFQIED